MDKPQVTIEKNKVLDFLIEYSKVLAFITFVFFLGVWTQNANNRMFDDLKQKTDIIQAVNDKETHKTVKDLTNEFVGKLEFRMTLESTNKNLIEINKNLEKIQDKQNK